MKTPTHFLLDDLGLTQSQLADLLMVSKSTLSRHLAGVRSLSEEAELQLVQLYKVALGVPPDAPPPAMQAESKPEPYALENAMALHKVAEHRYERVCRELVRINRLNTWLVAMQAHGHLVTAGRQQRCLAEMQYRLNKKNKQLFPLKAMLELQLVEIDQSITRLRGIKQLPGSA
ncbi:MAG TPA: helix-turn-helix transcriptional regulator [Phnomibacter sp.]|nr:helix-turn-helix transcriptional regulator [Phnomibacter sp.]